MRAVRGHRGQPHRPTIHVVARAGRFGQCERALGAYAFVGEDRMLQHISQEIRGGREMSHWHRHRPAKTFERCADADAAPQFLGQLRDAGATALCGALEHRLRGDAGQSFVPIRLHARTTALEDAHIHQRRTGARQHQHRHALRRAIHVDIALHPLGAHTHMHGRGLDDRTRSWREHAGVNQHTAVLPFLGAQQVTQGRLMLCQRICAIRAI